MKRLFVFFLCAMLLPFIHARAAEYTYTDSKVTSIKITTQRTTADVTVTYTGDISKSGSQGDVTVWKEKAANGSYGGKIFDEFLQFNKTKPTTATYKITGLEPKKTYYLSYMSAGHAFTTEATDTCTPDPNPADGIDKLGISYDGTIVILSGKFDATKHPCFLNFNLSIEVSKDSFDDASKQPGKILFTKPVQDLEKSAEGIGLDGRYFFRLANLDPETIYYFKQTVTDTTSGGLTKTTTGNFPSTKGTILVGSTQQSFEEHSYRLLAPFPGFTVLMDPELCAVQKAQHKIAPDAVCDVNDLLNFAFRLLIGVAAALLIFRIMLAGYQYITTDVPFLKNNAKTHIAQSALGILLALSAYLILNTINPKLVNNQFKLESLQLGVERTQIDDSTFYKITGQHLKTNSEYIPVAKKIAEDVGVNSCALQATVQVESEWHAGAIGCDEDVRSDNVPSRKAFLQSGITYNGTKFTPTSDSGAQQSNGACAFDASKAGYGLDWRFSKGGGLTQVTLFPEGYKTQAWYDGVKENGSYWKSRMTPFKGWETLIKPEENLKKGAQRLKQAFTECNGDVQAAFRQYQTGSCTGGGRLADITVARKYDLYKQCTNGK